MSILTVETLEKIPQGVIAAGIAPNSPEGIFATRETGHEEPSLLLWVAKRGRIHDWTIYYGPVEHGINEILEVGDKLYNKETIRRLVACTDEAFALYRF